MHQVEQLPRARLLISCADRPGIVALITGWLAGHAANIVDLAQHSTGLEADGRFFMRVEFEHEELIEREAEWRADFERATAGWELNVDWRAAQRAKRIAILVSRPEHCLLDLLWRVRRGDLHAELVMVASNHEDRRADTEGFGVPYHHVPADDKATSEARLLELLAGQVDLVVLARYMQILSGEFIDRLGVPIINIHHSFLPAFAGADPYTQAWRRGVKVIGATAHYVIKELDAGPIIDQDVGRVTHADDPASLARLGAELERSVLVRAVRLHLEDRVLLDGRKTVVFS